MAPREGAWRRDQDSQSQGAGRPSLGSQSARERRPGAARVSRGAEPGVAEPRVTEPAAASAAALRLRWQMVESVVAGTELSELQDNDERRRKTLARRQS